MCHQQYIFKTALPSIDVIVTNVIGGVYLNGQFLVAEIDSEAHECPQCYGLMPLIQALSQANQAVEEIRILASATVPDDSGF